MSTPPPRYLSLPFTLSTLLALVVAAASTSSLLAPLPPSRRQRLGFAPRDLRGRAWPRLLTSALVTHGRGGLARALASTTLAVGVAEHRHGTRRTAATFWGVHLGTLLALSCAVLTARKAGGERRAPPLPRDVGPSAGYLGCLGLVCSRLPAPWRRLAGASVGALLHASPLLPAPHPPRRALKLFADAAHLIAFPMGWISGSLPPSPQPRDGVPAGVGPGVASAKS